jgi:hypothetical protein
MKAAYNIEWLYNLIVIKETKRWLRQGFIETAQFDQISQAHPSEFYHPNFIIRVLLFVATLLALAGVTGLIALMVFQFGDDTAWFMFTLYGIISFVVVDRLFIDSNKHYKSGVTEALIYHAAGFTIGGIAGSTESPSITLVCAIIVFSLAAIRYLDLVCTAAAIAAICGFIFYQCDEAGGIALMIMPFIFIILFTAIYFVIRYFSGRSQLRIWSDNFTLAEGISLLIIYAAGNYMVVRELSIEMMSLTIEEGQDIPFAIIFYSLTAIIPIIYLYFGIRFRDVVLLRVSLIVVAFTVFTFKFYYGFGHPEITLTLAGVILIGITLTLMNYLKIIRFGFTRDSLLEEKWANSNLQAFIVSQTLGGNEVVPDEGFKGGDGGFGGGGASGEF